MHGSRSTITPVNHMDDELVKALVHDALALCDDASERELTVIKQELTIAEALLSNTATSDDRKAVYEFVHPSPRSHFLR